MRKRNIAIVSLTLVAIVFSAYALTLDQPLEISQEGDVTKVGVEIHVDAYHRRDGVLLMHSHHAGVLTTLGQNWIEDQLGDSPGADPAKWIALSNDASAPSSAWTAIPTEITTNGLTRAVGTYADDGNGAWTISKTFTFTGTQSCQLTGLYWALTGDYLLCSDTFTQVNGETDDTLEIVWSLSVTGT